jgi:hypothetical protein
MTRPLGAVGTRSTPVNTIDCSHLLPNTSHHSGSRPDDRRPAHGETQDAAPVGVGQTSLTSAPTASILGLRLDLPEAHMPPFTNA